MSGRNRQPRTSSTDALLVDLVFLTAVAAVFFAIAPLWPRFPTLGARYVVLDPIVVFTCVLVVVTGLGLRERRFEQPSRNCLFRVLVAVACGATVGAMFGGFAFGSWQSKADDGATAIWTVGSLGGVATLVLDVDGVAPGIAVYEVRWIEQTLGVPRVRVFVPEGREATGLYPTEGAEQSCVAVLAGRAIGIRGANGEWEAASSSVTFALLGDESAGDETVLSKFVADVSAVSEGAASSVPEDVAAYASGFDLPQPPAESSLLAGLASRNAWVRRAATQLIDAGGQRLYPSAVRRLAQSRANTRTD